jgi:hypothetical protein
VSAHILTSSFLCLACQGYVITLLATQLVNFLPKGQYYYVSTFLVEGTYCLNIFLERNVFECCDYNAMWKDWEPII